MAGFLAMKTLSQALHFKLPSRRGFVFCPCLEPHPYDDFARSRSVPASWPGMPGKAHE
jgi:hypothetical protein